MKKILLFLSFLCCFSFSVFAQQIEQPVTWKGSVAQIEGNVYEIILTGEISDKAWHTYDLGPYEFGPNPTVLTVDAKGNAKLIGTPYIKSEIHKSYDDIFEMEIGTCEGPVLVAQKIELTNSAKSEIMVNIEWQACNEGTCLPPTDVDIKIELPAAPEAVTATAESAKEEVKAEAAKEEVKAPAKDSSHSIWSIILEAMAWGFVMLLTPCVFPMIPMTVSFFIKQQGSKATGRAKAAFFGLSIIALYTLPITALILITFFTGGEAVTADIFNWIATHWIPNILFFVIFMFFAASFFGAFEITLPSWMVNKSDAKSEKGGFGGVFFMALTLVLVSFSCTGPIVGSVIIKSTQGGIWEPIITMLAFSTAFALPFTLFAFVPSLLKDLPKSGGWLNSVKVVLGFIEVALGFKFLSVADQVYHWHLLDREVYLAIWIVVFSLLGFYLLGKLKFANDDDVPHISVKRLALSIVSFSFVIYMLPGMWGAPLKALSGYLPPINTQDYVVNATNTIPVAATASAGPAKTVKYGDFLKLPLGLTGYFDYKEALAAAKEEGKPVFIDFTGHGCTNCREMESRVWSDPQVLERLRNDFVILALYVDDKTTVDKEDWITLDNGKVLKSLGKINSDFQVKRFNANAQPNYVLLDPSTEEALVEARGYNLDVDGFVKYLDSAIKAYNEKHSK